VTMRPESVDAAAAGGGTLVSAWNFLLGGELNVILGSLVAVLSVIVLFQRYLINRRELKKLNDRT